MKKFLVLAALLLLPLAAAPARACGVASYGVSFAAPFQVVQTVYAIPTVAYAAPPPCACAPPAPPPQVVTAPAPPPTYAEGPPAPAYGVPAQTYQSYFAAGIPTYMAGYLSNLIQSRGFDYAFANFRGYFAPGADVRFRERFGRFGFRDRRVAFAEDVAPVGGLRVRAPFTDVEINRGVVPVVGSRRQVIRQRTVIRNR